MAQSVPNPSVLVDVIARVADRAREIAHGVLGTRAFRVFVVTRTWTGPTRGEGAIVGAMIAADGTTISTEMELLPPPNVTFTSLHAETKVAGREEEGGAVIDEISLRYSESELYPDFEELTEWAIRMDDAHGTGSPSRYYFPDAPPTARRGDKAGDQQDWRLQVRRVLDLQVGDAY